MNSINLNPQINSVNHYNYNPALQSLINFIDSDFGKLNQENKSVIDFINVYDLYYASLDQNRRNKTDEFLSSKDVTDLFKKDKIFFKTVVHMIDMRISKNQSVDHLLPILSVGNVKNIDEEFRGSLVQLLLSASRENQPRLVKLILDLNADINAKDHVTGETCMHSACLKSNDKVLEVLLQNEKNKKSSKGYAKPLKTKFQETPIHSAVKGMSVKCVKLLLDDKRFSSEKMINSLNKNKESALQLASQRKKIEVVNLLLSAKADPFLGVNTFDGKSIESACKNNDLEVFKKLTEHEIPDSIKNNLLSLTIRYLRADMTQYLLDRGLDINEEYAFGDQLIHSIVKDGITNNKRDVVKLLIEKKANVNSLGSDRKTPLKLASEKGYMDVAQLLIQSGANVGDLTIPPPKKSKDWNLTIVQKDIFKWMLSNKALLEKDHYIFTHGASRISAFFQDVISGLNQENKISVRVPGVGMQFKNVQSFINSNWFPRRHPVTKKVIVDNIINDSVISCDGLLFNKDIKESALYFFTRNENISNSSVLINKIKNQFKTHVAFIRNNNALQNLLFNEIDASLNNLQTASIYGGRYLMFAIKKETVESPETNYVWRSHPFGFLCQCNRGGEFGLGHDNFINILKQHNQGKIVRCESKKVPTQNLPQYRILAKNFENDPNKRINFADSLSNEKFQIYQQIVSKPQNLLRQFAMIDRLSNSSTVQDVLKYLDVTLFDCQGNEGKFGEYLNAMSIALNSKRDQIEDKIHQGFDYFNEQTRKFLADKILSLFFAQLDSLNSSNLNNFNLNTTSDQDLNNYNIPELEDEFIDYSEKFLSKRKDRDAEVIKIDDVEEPVTKKRKTTKHTEIIIIDD